MRGKATRCVIATWRINASHLTVTMQWEQDGEASR